MLVENFVAGYKKRSGIPRTGGRENLISPCRAAPPGRRSMFLVSKRRCE